MSAFNIPVWWGTSLLFIVLPQLFDKMPFWNHFHPLSSCSSTVTSSVVMLKSIWAISPTRTTVCVLNGYHFRILTFVFVLLFILWSYGGCSSLVRLFDAMDFLVSNLPHAIWSSLPFTLQAMSLKGSCNGGTTP